MSLFEYFRSGFSNGLKSLKSSKRVTKIRLGICAMDKKARSKPMNEILGRLSTDLFEIIIFGNDVILNEPIEKWPVVECLIAFSSTNYPTLKVLDYIKLTKPYVVNDLETDYNILQDRRKVYNALESAGIDVPFHVFVERDRGDITYDIEEHDEFITINGIQIKKPFVEKPVDAEDHNIFIYYPMSAGGGSKRLFRKVGDQSSQFYPLENEVRRDGSFIYEEFVNTQGTDVKVYTVGPDYGHAEARKSPVVDGKVKRDDSGIEVRYPVILSAVEKEISRKIVLTFKQTVCGFDILRVQGRSYVCDVNGFSFVKNSRKYYDDCSQILTELLLVACRPESHANLSAACPLVREASSAYTKKPSSLSSSTASRQGSPRKKSNAAAYSSTPIPEDDSDDKSQCSMYDMGNDGMSREGVHLEELRCVIAITRHGDRTPKQKIKINVDEPRYLKYFKEYSKSPLKELRVKARAAMVRFLEVTRETLVDYDSHHRRDELYHRLRQIRDVLERWEISGINRKMQMKPIKWEEGTNEIGETVTTATELLIVLKWGGDLTQLGRNQAELLGAEFRKAMYPDPEGGGVLRLHSTYRHDLKIRSSDEGRVMKTAAAFTKGLLDLEGPLTPILVSLVTVEEKSMLDQHGNDAVKIDTDRCKEHLNAIQVDKEVDEELLQLIAPARQASVRGALQRIQYPLQGLRRMHALISNICEQLAKYCEEVDAASEHQGDSVIVQNQSLKLLYSSETCELMHERWKKMKKGFYDKTSDRYDLTKVPDVYDMSRYDMIHNSELALDDMEELYRLSNDFADFIVPQEYGLDKLDKRIIGSKTCNALLEKIKLDLHVALSDSRLDMRYLLDLSHADDLAINSLGRCVRTRLYFTSESHLQTLVNVLRYPANPDACAFSQEGCQILEETPELSYLTTIVIRVFVEKSNSQKFRCEISFSAGACEATTSADRSIGLSPFVCLNKSLKCDQLMSCLDDAISAGIRVEGDANGNGTGRVLGGGRGTGSFEEDRQRLQSTDFPIMNTNLESGEGDWK